MMNENNTNTQVNNSSVGGMNFVTGASSGNSNQTATEIQNNNTAGTMNFVTQSVTDTVNPQPAPEPIANQTIIPQPISPSSISSGVESQTVINQANTVESNLNSAQVNTVSQNVNTVATNQNVNELRNMVSEQPNNAPINQAPSVPSSLEEAPEGKKRNPIIVILIIVLLTVIGVALGIFLFTKFGNKNDNQGESTNIEDNVTTTLNNNVIDNVDVDNTKLNEVLSIVGIASSNSVKNNDSLNYFVSNENYKDNAKDIIVSSVVSESESTSSEIEYPDEYDKMSDVGACSEAISCALISKDDALKTLKKFNFGTDLDKYFYKSSEIDNVYGIHYEALSTMFNSDGTGIVHNLKAEMVNDTEINVSDTQTINTIDDNGEVQSVNKIVTYVFKLGEDNSYYLDNVTVS